MSTARHDPLTETVWCRNPLCRREIPLRAATACPHCGQPQTAQEREEPDVPVPAGDPPLGMLFRESLGDLWIPAGWVAFLAFFFTHWFRLRHAPIPFVNLLVFGGIALVWWGIDCLRNRVSAGKVMAGLLLIALSIFYTPLWWGALLVWVVYWTRVRD